MFERVTINYQTLQTWIGHNGKRYHNFNALLHALPHALHTFSLRFAWFGAICNGLTRVTVKFI